MYKFSKYKEQYRANLRLALPVIMSQLGQIVVQLADNTMVGQYGGNDPLPLAAASFGGSLFMLSFLAVMGLTFGITPLAGELYAQKRYREAGVYLQNSALLYTTMAVIFAFVQLAIIPLMWHMGQPDDVVALAIPYYKMMVWGLVPTILFFTFKQFLEGIGNTKVAMYIVIFCNVVNISLNYLFIGGKLGAPEMGVDGAGLATLISRILQAIIIVAYVIKAPSFRVYIENFARRHFSFAAIKRLINLGAPISLQIFMEASTFIMIGFMFGWFGAEAISANQISTSIANSSFMIIIAIGSATTIRISHCFGLRDFAEMKLAAKAAWHLGLFWNVLAAIVILSLRSVIPMIFTSNEEVIEVTSVLLITIATYQILDGVQCIGVGVMRGMQDVRIIPAIAFFAYWLCNIPIAYICAFKLNMGVTGLYTGFILGFSIAAALIIWRIRYRQRWLLKNKRALS